MKFVKQIVRGALSVTTVISCHTPSPPEWNESESIQSLNSHPDKSSWPENFGFGRTATSAEIDSLSIAILPNGKGLPAGEGTALSGKSIYLQKCAACHGPTGREGPQDVLVNTESVFSDERREAKAIGNYWPYSTTVFDYIRRAMPSNAPGSLTNEEVYSLTAWLLFQNGLIAERHPINAKSLPLVKMPARDLFVEDDRTAGPNPKY